jgi:hypothetical protein
MNSEQLKSRAAELEREWGSWDENWKVIPSTNELEFVGHAYAGIGYRIDLDRCKSAEQAMDWLLQIQSKGWGTPEALYDLLKAFRDITPYKPMRGHI